jgi:hypothetical protein
MLFERLPKFVPVRSYRPQSLHLTPHCAELCGIEGAHFDEDQFRCIVCFGQCYKPDGKKIVTVRYRSEFDDILNR